MGKRSGDGRFLGHRLWFHGQNTGEEMCPSNGSIVKHPNHPGEGRYGCQARKFGVHGKMDAIDGVCGW